MDYEKIKGFQENLTTFKNERESLLNLVNGHNKRKDDFLWNFACTSTAYSDSDKVYYDFDDELLYDLLKFRENNDLIYLKGVPENYSRPPFHAIIADLKERHISLFTEKGYIIISVYVTKDYADVTTLLKEVEDCRKEFASETLINIQRVPNTEGNRIKCGYVIPFLGDSNKIAQLIKNKDVILVDGISAEHKRKFARAVVKRYMKENPNLKFSELKENLSVKLGALIINDVESINKWKDDGHVAVWRGEILTSSDGVQFKVYDQWKMTNLCKNFQKVIDFAKQQGYLD